MSILAGVDQLNQLNNARKSASILGFEKSFQKPELSFYSRASLFKDKVDYEIGVSKYIRYNTNFGYGYIAIKIFNESFRNYNDVGMSISLPLDLIK